MSFVDFEVIFYFWTILLTQNFTQTVFTQDGFPNLYTPICHIARYIWIFKIKSIADLNFTVVLRFDTFFHSVEILSVTIVLKRVRWVLWNLDHQDEP